MKLAVAIIHGIGTQKPGFSIPLQRGIAKYYQKHGLGFNWDDLIFKELLWADKLAPMQQDLFERLAKNHKLNYQSLRQFFIHYLGDVLAYQSTPLNNENKDDNQRQRIYQQIANDLTQFEQLALLPSDTPLILIGHSLGSVILFDYIKRAQKAKNRSAHIAGCQQLAGFITLGSPLALWSLRYPDFGHALNFPPKTLAPRIKDKARWLNIYDKDDVVAYPLKPINQAYEHAVSADIALNIGPLHSSWNPLSHNGYWQDSDLHQCIARFLASLQAP